MNVKQTVKKMSAIAAGVFMVGLTVSSASALDLSDYPEPFVQDGAFQGKIVIGAKAQAADTLAAIDVATSLQASSVTPTDGSGSSVVVTGGDDFEVNFNTVFPTTGDIIYDSADLNGFVDSRIRWNREDIDVREQLILRNDSGKIVTSAYITSTNEAEAFAKNPHLTMARDAIEYRYVFESEINTSQVSEDQPLKIKFLGEDWEIVSVPGTDRVVVEASEKRYMDVGESVTYDGRTVTLEAVGTNSVRVNVDGERKVIANGQTEEFSGEFEVSASNLFYQESGTMNGAELRFGTEVRTTVRDGQSAELFGQPSTNSNAEWVWSVNMTSGATDNFVGLKRQHESTRLSNLNLNSEKAATAVGESISLPNNYASVEFAGFTSTQYSDVSIDFREIRFDADNLNQSAVLSTNANRDAFYLGTGNNLRSSEIAVVSNGNAFNVWYVDNSGDWQTAPDNNIRFRPGKSEAEVVITPAANTGNWAFEIPMKGGDTETLNLNVTYNNDGYRFLGVEGEATASGLTTGTGPALGTREHGVRLSSGAHFDEPRSQLESDRFRLSVPHDLVEATIVVSSSQTRTTSTGASGGAYVVNPISAGAAILDSEASGLVGNTPLIVVGGPYVNTIAASLLGNPSEEEIENMFESGLAKIRLFSSQNALLVAGYSATDTRGAAYVLANYQDFASQMTGTEVEVVVTDATTVQVRQPTN